MRHRRISDMWLATSEELTDVTVRWRLVELGGYKWIRAAVRPWQISLRNPVVGQLFEITRYEVPGGVLLNSVEASRMIRKRAVG
jgi:hypothetical protein